MEKTCQQEKSKQDARPKRDAKGRLLPGNSANLAGKNGYTAIKQLLTALENRGIKKKESFWDMVAKKVWENPQVLIAVLKKIIPDRQTLEHGLTEHLLEKYKEMDIANLAERARELTNRIAGIDSRN